MEIINATNPRVVDFLEPHLLEDEDYGGKEHLAEMLRYMLSEGGENLRIYVAFEGSELRGYIIAFNAPQKLHVFLVQVWVNAKEPSLADRLFSRIVLWTDSLGKKEIRAETKRNPIVMERRWNFQPFSQIVSFCIPDDYAQRIIDVGHSVVIGRIEENGQEQQARDNGGQSDSAGGQASVQSVDAADANGSAIGPDDLPRPDDSKPNAGDGSGEELNVPVQWDVDEESAGRGVEHALE